MTDFIVFDKDGVILDLEATWLPVVRAVAHYTVSRIPEDCNGSVDAQDLLAAIGVNESEGRINSRGIFAAGSFADTRDCWQEMLPKHMIRLNQDEKYNCDVRELVERFGRGKTVPKGNVENSFRRLLKQGYKLAILTNDTEKNAKKNMQDLGILDLFCIVIGADSGYGSKPDPRGYLECCNVAGIPVIDSLMVGDTIADYGVALAANAGGFICVADCFEDRPHKEISRNMVIRSLDQLPELMFKLSSTKHLK